MKKPDPTSERKILLDIVEQLKDPDKTLHKQMQLKRFIYSVGWIGLVTAFMLAINDMTHIIVTTFIAGMAGSAVGFGTFLDFAQKQWPVTMRHIDLDSVKMRLDEL
jgi:hypothetical protein